MTKKALQQKLVELTAELHAAMASTDSGRRERALNLIAEMEEIIAVLKRGSFPSAPS